MLNNDWYEVFIDILYKKFPKKTQLTNEMMKLLSIEREAVYRRLRKDVLLSAEEIIKIASAWELSLDEITNINSGQYSFQMKQMNYLEPSNEEIRFLNSVIQGIYNQKNYPKAEFMDICNKLPRQFLAGYHYLNHFFLFKWKYQYRSENEPIPFSKIPVSQEKLNITTEYYKAIKYVPISNFIFDRNIFEYLINDIKYFYSIYLITDKEKELIKKDLNDLINYLQEVANKGCYPETLNKVNLYISQINVDTNYSYSVSPEVNVCFIVVFEKFEIFSFNSEMVNNFMAWMQLKKRTSIQISEVDERSRIEFFTKQRKLINSL